MSNGIQTLEVLLDPKTREIKYFTYLVEGLGDFRREGSKWVPNYEETDGQFEELVVFELDATKSRELVDKWDTNTLTESDLAEYVIEE
jgi:hypothetical protein